MRTDWSTAHTRGATGLLSTTTSAALSDIADAINTTGKTTGLAVYNGTTHIVMIADGAAAASTWTSADGLTVITPA